MAITPIAAKYPAAVVAQADLGGPLNAIPANELVLNTSLAAGDLSVVATVTIPATFPTSGWLTIDSELMHYSSYTSATFTIDVRGAQTAYGHVAATTHTAGATIGLYYTAQALDQLHSEVIALETGPLRPADGTVAAPAHAFFSEAGSGLYRIGAGDVGLSILGVKRAEFTATAALFMGQVATGVLPGGGLPERPTCG